MDASQEKAKWTLGTSMRKSSVYELYYGLLHECLGLPRLDYVYTDFA